MLAFLRLPKVLAALARLVKAALVGVEMVAPGVVALLRVLHARASMVLVHTRRGRRVDAAGKRLKNVNEQVNEQ